MKEFYFEVFAANLLSGGIQYFLFFSLFPRFLAAGKLKKLKEKVSPFLFGSFAVIVISTIGIIHLLNHLDVSEDLKWGLPSKIAVASVFCQFGIFIAGLVLSVRLERKVAKEAQQGSAAYRSELGELVLPPREVRFRMNKTVWGFLALFSLMNALFIGRGRAFYDEAATRFFGRPALARILEVHCDPSHKTFTWFLIEYPDASGTLQCGGTFGARSGCPDGVMGKELAVHYRPGQRLVTRDDGVAGILFWPVILGLGFFELLMPVLFVLVLVRSRRLVLEGQICKARVLELRPRNFMKVEFEFQGKLISKEIGFEGVCPPPESQVWVILRGSGKSVHVAALKAGFRWEWPL